MLVFQPILQERPKESPARVHFLSRLHFFPSVVNRKSLVFLRNIRGHKPAVRSVFSGFDPGKG